jgi:hypothetical protein
MTSAVRGSVLSGESDCAAEPGIHSGSAVDEASTPACFSQRRRDCIKRKRAGSGIGRKSPTSARGKSTRI